MKLRPLLFPLAALALITAMGSCTRTYTCQCQISYSGQPGLPDTTVKEYTIKDTKSKAKSFCEGNSVHSTQDGITTVEDCHLY